MNYVNAFYNPKHNCIDITHYDGYILQIDCAKAEENLKTTPNSQGLLNALAIGNTLEYSRLAQNNEMADWVWAVDNLNMEIICLIKLGCLARQPNFSYTVAIMSQYIG